MVPFDNPGVLLLLRGTSITLHFPFSPPLLTIATHALPDGVWVRPTVVSADADTGAAVVPAVFLPTAVAQYIDVLHGMMECGMLPHASTTADDPVDLQVEPQTLELLLNLFSEPQIQYVVANERDNAPPSPGGRRRTLTLEELASFHQRLGALPPLQSVYNAIYPLHADDAEGNVLGRALRALEQLDYVGGGVAMHGQALHIVDALDRIPDAILMARLCGDDDTTFREATA